MKLFEEAITLARRTPCSPQTLTRAARDFSTKQPQFACEAGMIALHWLMEGYGYDITTTDVLSACTHTLCAANNLGQTEQVLDWIEELVAKNPDKHFINNVLERQLKQTRSTDKHTR